MADYILRAILAHIVADLLLQPDFLSKKKKRKKEWILLHSLIVFLSLCFFGWGVLSIRWVFLSISISLLHTLIDWERIKFVKKEGILVGIIDQTLHIGGIWLLVYIVYRV
jgi:hypothetical protein